MADACGHKTFTADEKDFPVSLSSVKGAMKTLMKPFSTEPEPVVWDDSDEYSNNHGRCGIALIIINETFRGHKGRSGSHLDATNLSRTFSMLGFEVRIVKDCTAQELRHVLRSVAKEDHSDSDCFVLAMSSHGDELIEDDMTDRGSKKKIREDVVFCTDFFVTTRQIVVNFSDAECPTLKGKPRIFFLQACRGDQLDDGQELKVVHSAKDQMAEDEVDAIASDAEMIVSPAPCFKDFLIMCATPPGHFAFRRPAEGSWFVQALCAILGKCDGTEDVLQLLTRVVRMVAQEYMSFTPLNPDTDKKKQTPCIYSMLTKDLYWRVRKQPGRILTWQ